MPNLVRRAGMRDGKTMESVWETDGETPELMLSDSSDDGDSDSDSEQAASCRRTLAQDWGKTVTGNQNKLPIYTYYKKTPNREYRRP